MTRARVAPLPHHQLGPDQNFNRGRRCCAAAYALGMADAPVDPLDERVLNVLRERGPLTVAEIAKVVRQAGQYPIHAALRRLEHWALVRLAGTRSEAGGAGEATVRRTVSVWEATPDP